MTRLRTIQMTEDPIPQQTINIPEDMLEKGIGKAQNIQMEEYKDSEIEKLQDNVAKAGIKISYM